MFKDGLLGLLAVTVGGWVLGCWGGGEDAG
jgi:hypothetical protein